MSFDLVEGVLNTEFRVGSLLFLSFFLRSRVFEAPEHLRAESGIEAP